MVLNNPFKLKMQSLKLSVVLGALVLLLMQSWSSGSWAQSESTCVPNQSLEGPVDNFHTIDCYRLYRGARPADDSAIAGLAKVGINTIINLEGGDCCLLAWVFEPGERLYNIKAEKEAGAANNIKVISTPISTNRKINGLCDDIQDQLTLCEQQGCMDEEIKELKQDLLQCQQTSSSLKAKGYRDYFEDYQNQLIPIEQALLAMHDPANGNVYVHCAHGKDRTGMIVAMYRKIYQCWSTEKALQEMVSDGHAVSGVTGFFSRLITASMDEIVRDESIAAKIRKDLHIPDCENIKN